MVGLALGQVIAGTLSDRLGRKPPLITGLAAYVALSLACSLAPSIEIVIVLRLFQGMAGGSSMVIARAIVRDTYGPTHSARAFSLLMLAAGVAPIAAPVLGGQLLLVTSWRGLFAVLAVLVSGLLLAAIWRVPESLPVDQRHSGGFVRWLHQAKSVFTDPVFCGAAAVQCLMGAGMFTFIGMSAFVFQDHYGFDAQGYGLLFAAISVGIVSFSRVSAWAATRRRPVVVMGWGVSIALVGAIAQFVAISLGAAPLLVAIPLFLCISSGGLISPNCHAMALRNQGQRSGTASGLLGLIQFGVGAATAPLVSLAGATAFAMGSAMLTSTVLMGVTYLFAVRRSGRFD
jgi:DHA1 family bicyclomycin/chloramphenicol resistance-like MFS transporter